MKKFINYQLKNAFCSSGFIRILIFMIIFSIVSFVIKCVTVFKAEIVTVPSAYEQFFLNGINFEYVTVFEIIFPFAICAAFSDSYVSDCKSNYININIIRGNSKQYYFSKMIAVYIIGFLIMFLPQILNYVLCIITFPINSTKVYTQDLWQSDFFISSFNEHFFYKSIYLLSPYLYFLLYIFISSIMAGFISLIAYQASYFVKNKIFVISFMFILMNLSFRILDERSITYDLNEYIFGNYTSGQVYSHMIIVFAFYIILALLPTPFALKKLRNCL
jgi:hypothetical protein